MPRYFFNRVGGRRDDDQEGIELPGPDHARYEAVAFAADTLKDGAYALWDGGEVRIEVVDVTSTMIFTILISTIDPTIVSAPCNGDQPPVDTLT